MTRCSYVEFSYTMSLLTPGNTDSTMQTNGTAQSSHTPDHSVSVEHAVQSILSSTTWDELLANTKCYYPSLTVTSHDGSDGRWALIEGAVTTSSPLGTKLPTRNPRMVVHVPSESPSHIQYKFEVHFVLLFQGLTTDEQFGVLLQSLLPGSSYCLCPGMPEDLRERVDFECKSARKWGFPLQRTDHVDCQMWFQAQTTSHLRQEPMCEKCKSLLRYLRKRLRTLASVSPTRIGKRALPSSRCPWKYLSPAARRLRQSRVRREKSFTKKKLDKYYHFDVGIGEAAHKQLLELLPTIQYKSRDELEALLAEDDVAENIASNFPEELQGQ